MHVGNERTLMAGWTPIFRTLEGGPIHRDIFLFLFNVSKQKAQQMLDSSVWIEPHALLSSYLFTMRNMERVFLVLHYLSKILYTGSKNGFPGKGCINRR